MCARSEAVVLVVCEDPLFRTVLAAMLLAHGHESRAVADRLSAVAVIEELGSSVRAVVIVVRLSSEAALSTLTALRAIAPGLTCVLVAGTTSPCSDDALRGAGGASVIHKPNLFGPLGFALSAQATQLLCWSCLL